MLNVYDALCISHRDEYVLHSKIGNYFCVNEGSAGLPIIYIGNKISKFTIDNGVDTCPLSLSQCFQDYIYLMCISN